MGFLKPYADSALKALKKQAEKRLLAGKIFITKV